MKFMTINKCLKKIKSDIYTDFVCIINNEVVITTNKPANASDLKIIEKYIKNSNNINLKAIKSPYLPKSKLYLKIIGLSYIGENGPITSNSIKCYETLWTTTFFFFFYLFFSILYFFSFEFLFLFLFLSSDDEEAHDIAVT